MKKVVLALAAAALGLAGLGLAGLGLAGLGEAAVVDGIQWKYELTEGGNATICGEDILSGGERIAAIPKSTTGAVVIPSSLGGHPVTAIGVRAFRDCSGLTSVTIPSSVTSIGASAFWNCEELNKLTFKGPPPEGVVEGIEGIAGRNRGVRVEYPPEHKDQWWPVLVDCGLVEPTGADAETGVADKGAAKRMNRAGFRLLEAVARRHQGENALISPYSIDSAFTLAWLGAQGETAEQIKQTLGLPDKPGEVMGRLDLALSGSRRAQVLTSNSIWLDQKRELLGDYEAAVRKDFRMGLFKSDFGDAAGTAGKINDLIDRKTKGMIKNALSPSAITSDTELLLVNTLYFKGKWAKPFEKDNTHKEDFTLSSDAKVKVDMMYDQRDARYAEHDGTKAILLPYEGGRFGFVAILPPKGVPAEALLKGLSDDGVAKWVAAMRTEDTKIWLPKLDFEFREGLVETLKAAGMEVPFADNADFKRMTGRPLKISEVIHVTKLRMDEIETEAAAATVICSECTASPFQPPPPKEFHADHPYVGVIYDTATGLALFVGVVNDPSR